MRLLVAYDGSKCSEAALDDLVRARLPDPCEALVISVAEVWLPPPNGGDTGIIVGAELEASIQRHHEKSRTAVAEAETLANHAKKRLQGMFPSWSVEATATCGSPAWAVLDRADQFKPDLIVIGSHGRSAISRFFLGSVSQKILTEARCSVRVARGRIEVDPTPVRVIIGFDGSKGAQNAVDAVANRSWPDRSEIRLIAATQEVSPTAVGRFIQPIDHFVDEVNDSEHAWIEKLAYAGLKKLQTETVSADLRFHPGNPKDILVERAGSRNVDCIFVGANAFGSRRERFLLGSTSAAVAARAHCSVEVSRV